MPWFITSVSSDPDIQPHKRTFGFYDTYNQTHETVVNNRGNLQECLYDYLVIEYMEPGIHPLAYVEEWWEWNTQLHRWDKLQNKPKKYLGMISWAMG